MSSDDTVGEQQVPERPGTRTTDDEIDEERERRKDRLSSITLEPGARETANVNLLKIEAELVADGHEPDNPATPIDTSTGESFLDQIEDTELVPAWTRPWEDDK